MLWLFSFFSDVNSFVFPLKKFNFAHFSEAWAIFTELFLFIVSFSYPLIYKGQLKRTKNKNYKNLRTYVKCCKIQNTIQRVHKERLSLGPGRITLSEFLKPSEISH